MQLRYLAVAAAITLGACGDDGAKDASIDIDNGSCGSDLHFTGELVDWDTHTTFCGIKDATLAVPGGAMDSTAPNGRFDLCIPGGDTFTTLNVMFSATPSECTQPSSTYTTPTIFYADHGVIKAGGFYSGRSITMDRLPQFFAAISSPFDATKGQVFIHVTGPASKVTLAAAHGPEQAVVGSAWGIADQGTDLLFPNVDVGSGTTKVTIEGGGVGETEIPVVAGTITNAAVIAR